MDLNSHIVVPNCKVCLLLEVVAPAIHDPIRQTITKQRKRSIKPINQWQAFGRCSCPPITSTMSADLDLSGTYPYFPIITFLGMVWVLVPSAGHFRKGNSGTLLLIFWIFSLNLIFFVDTIVWHANIRNPHPVWCDIGTRGIFIVFLY